MREKVQLGRGGTLGNLKGQSGVYAVASRLCLQGHVPYFPGVDHGVDLVIENGLRLQVKVACLTYPDCGGKTFKNYLGGAYGFNLRRGLKDRQDYRGVADFFVLWGMDENRFWVVPTSIKNRVIWFGRADHPNGSNNATYTSALKEKRCLEYENRWDLLDVGSVKSLIDSVAPSPALQEKS